MVYQNGKIVAMSLTSNGVPISIEEYDTDDGWHVRKWSSGYVEMCITKFYPIQQNTLTSSGGLYVAAGIYPHIPFPLPLVERYCEVATCQPFYEKYLAGYCAPRGIPDQYSLTQTMEYSMYRTAPFPDNADDWIAGINIVVNGRWKSSETTTTSVNELTVTVPETVSVKASSAKTIDEI